MAKASYYELLKHPKWQEKRLRIMERAGFKCENCEENESMLAVHHSYYERGLDPWEYPDESLHCLCDPCHKYAETLRVGINRLLGEMDFSRLLQLLGILKGLDMERDLSIVHTADQYSEMYGMVRIFATINADHNHRRVEALLFSPFSQRAGINGRVLLDAVETAEGKWDWPHGSLYDGIYGGSVIFDPDEDCCLAASSG